MHRSRSRFLSAYILLLPLLLWSGMQEALAGSHATHKGYGPSKAHTASRYRHKTSMHRRHRSHKAAKAAKAARHHRTHRTRVAARHQASHHRRHHHRHPPQHRAIAAAGTLRQRYRSAGHEPHHIPHIESQSVLVVDDKGRPIFSKDIHEVRPIASITKLMTAMVVLDARLPMGQGIIITQDDCDTLRHSRSRLRQGKATLSRREMLQIALMSSENRAAAALARTSFPGGTPAFVAAMNRKARALGMTDSHFVDPTGLHAGNVSTAADLVKMVQAASHYPLIRAATTTPSTEVRPYAHGRPLRYVNTNRLVQSRDDAWDIHLSKTGFINEAGRCLVMEARLPEGTYHFVLLNAPGKLSPIGDSNRLRRWIEHGGS
jgi:serine-type D-Ala-D-Ala endopeptidase (penicillin-binding protein 7)